ncbi:MAG: polyphosphate--glucose phosphotransferase [Chloroflexota bacterium]
MIAIGIDVGGSAIKGGAVDVDEGSLLTERMQVPTPHPATPEAVVETIRELVARVSADDDEPVGVTLPSVVIDGVSWTAANIDAGWVQFDAEAALRTALNRDVIVLNDADAAGLAEMRFGAGCGRNGVVLMLTLGTGVGSALFVDGKLVPNTELGHMEIRGMDAEKRSAAIARVRDNESWEKWAADLDEHLKAIDRILWPSLIIVGGGVSDHHEKFVPLLTVRPPIVRATLGNDAGTVGAAMAAAERAAPA